MNRPRRLLAVLRAVAVTLPVALIVGLTEFAWWQVLLLYLAGWFLCVACTWVGRTLPAWRERRRARRAWREFKARNMTSLFQQRNNRH